MNLKKTVMTAAILFAGICNIGYTGGTIDKDLQCLIEYGCDQATGNCSVDPTVIAAAAKALEEGFAELASVIPGSSDVKTGYTHAAEACKEIKKYFKNTSKGDTIQNFSATTRALCVNVAQTTSLACKATGESTAGKSKKK